MFQPLRKSFMDGRFGWRIRLFYCFSRFRMFQPEKSRVLWDLGRCLESFWKLSRQLPETLKTVSRHTIVRNRVRKKIAALTVKEICVWGKGLVVFRKRYRFQKTGIRFLKTNCCFLKMDVRITKTYVRFSGWNIWKKAEAIKELNPSAGTSIYKGFAEWLKHLKDFLAQTYSAWRLWGSLPENGLLCVFGQADPIAVRLRL